MNSERPFIAPGVELRRNAFSNNSLYDVDMRVQKGFNFDERRRLVLSAEFFNVFNLSNIQLSSFTSTNYCSSSAANCGLAGITNANFRQIREQRTTQPLFGQILLSNNPGSQVFQMQFGARLQF